RQTELTADPRGDFRPYIGYRKDGKQQRFNLGKNNTEAKARVDRIRRLYLESIAVRESYQLKPSWTEAALHAARNIAQGMEQVPLPSCHVIDEACGERLQYPDYDPCWDPALPAAMLWSHAVASRLYPSVNWVFPDTAAGRVAFKTADALFEAAAKRQAAVLNINSPPEPITGKLHEALDGYWEGYIKTLARSPQTLHQRHTMIEKLKRVHADFPLAVLGLDQCEAMYRYWTERPSRDDEKGRLSKKADCATALL
ncbi:MAG: hypothetical protein KDA57_21275, partial [Planctomycetales bacterium]|nr:hypothetical protein [Planctomycetales bacterium]